MYNKCRFILISPFAFCVRQQEEVHSHDGSRRENFHKWLLRICYGFASTWVLKSLIRKAKNCMEVALIFLGISLAMDHGNCMKCKCVYWNYTHVTKHSVYHSFRYVFSAHIYSKTTNQCSGFHKYDDDDKQKVRIIFLIICMSLKTNQAKVKTQLKQ